MGNAFASAENGMKERNRCITLPVLDDTVNFEFCRRLNRPADDISTALFSACSIGHQGTFPLTQRFNHRTFSNPFPLTSATMDLVSKQFTRTTNAHSYKLTKSDLLRDTFLYPSLCSIEGTTENEETQGTANSLTFSTREPPSRDRDIAENTRDLPQRFPADSFSPRHGAAARTE